MKAAFVLSDRAKEHLALHWAGSHVNSNSTMEQMYDAYKQAYLKLTELYTRDVQAGSAPSCEPGQEDDGFLDRNPLDPYDVYNRNGF